MRDNGPIGFYVGDEAAGPMTEALMRMARRVPRPRAAIRDWPLWSLPGWLTVLNRLDPITYAVSPMRTLVFANLDISAAAHETLNPPITWFGWEVPIALQIFTVFALGMVMLGIAIAEFNAGE